MKNQLQFELWQDCNSKCDFCYLNWFAVDKSKKHKIEKINHVLDILSDDALYEKYDTISLIGGEFFQGQINDPEVNERFFALIKKIRWLLDTGRINTTWIMVSLLIGEQPDLYKTLDILGNDSRVWYNTSWDIVGRFKSDKMLKTWEKHIDGIHRKCPDVKVNTTMILTHELIQAYLQGSFSFTDFQERYRTHLFLKPPAFNEVTQFVYWKQNPHEVQTTELSNLDLKRMFSSLIGTQFFPTRHDFLNFLMKFKNDVGARAYRDLFNIERRADDLYVTLGDGHTEYKQHREKTGNGFANTTTHLNTCGHSYYYAGYMDSDKCMLCDKQYIGAL